MSMSLFTPQFQIHSDLHLETPIIQPTYTHFSSPTSFPVHASNLCLLGDIGYARSPALFAFLRSLLSRTPNLKIFYVLGNHEAYGIALSTAISTMENFESETHREFGERFFFMNRRRVDVGAISILGCTLWSRIEDGQAKSCARLLTDFKDELGIKGRGVEQHNADHGIDLAWLNQQVWEIEEEEPGREIIVLTHHSPTRDPRANDPRHVDSEVNSGFVTDLSKELCWRSGNLKVWGFGHTHYNCRFREGGKLVVANQKGYCGLDREGNWEVRSMVVEGGINGWKVVMGADGGDGGGDVSNGPEERRRSRDEGKGKKKGKEGKADSEKKRRSILRKAEEKIKGELGLGGKR
ncbi:hypothetical protein K469DRAFT_707172 [Zopfia rhizophila CBS 207.26]|uniref:Calcineurin-like phosphoesterase domain-containing protein n=1 Tax=Zopfia rhizophila CBS 207.26 TaxID=1314779 RepID=A0A6A6E693_9PEZI|nr:hypothetical protein K469DRAFT_707172 [Zopfia rhizophila CBS 207.26]